MTISSPWPIRFWESALTLTTPNAARHFVDSIADWLESVITQAEDRQSRIPRTIEEFQPYRTINVAVIPTYLPWELRLNIPDEVFYHPAIKEIKDLVAYLVSIDNVRPHSSFRCRSTIAHSTM